MEDKRLETLSRKTEKYWAEMRTNKALMLRSPKFDDYQVDEMCSELRDCLDSGILSYPPTLQEAGIEPGMTYQERRKAFGLRSYDHYRTPNEKKFLTAMSHKADRVRKCNWSWRIANEAQEKQEQKWHPFFVTLTVDSKKADSEQLWKEGREFRKYIRRLVNVVCKELGHPPAHKKPYRPESDYVTYSGVIEHGKSAVHHHGHFLIWMRAIPSNWRVCPNRGILNPKNRTKNVCLPMSILWPWSSYDTETGLPLSPALYFRTIGDIWSTKYNFVLPLKDGKPMKVSVPRVAGAYITKYLSKEHKEWHHRMKATRNLGMVKLKQIVAQMSLETATALSWRPLKSDTNYSVMMIHSVPIGLLRQLAKQQVFLIQYKHGLLGLKTLLRSNLGVFQKMLMSVKDGARPDRMDSMDFYDWVGQFLPEIGRAHV